MPNTGNKKHVTPWIKDLGGGAVQARYGRTPAHVHLPKYFQATPDDGKMPDAELKLQWAHGYNGEVVGGTHWTSDSKFLFPISGLCVLESLRQPAEQRFFVGHSEEVTCVAFNETRGLCASGQVDPPGEARPYVCVWREVDCIFLSAIVFHEVQVQAVGFNPAGSLLFTLGCDPSNLLAAWVDFVPADFSAEVKPGFDVEARIAKLPLVLRDPQGVISTGKAPAFTMTVYDQPSPDVDACFMTYDSGHGNAGFALKFWACEYNEETKVVVLKGSNPAFGQSPQPRRALFCSWTSDRKSIVCGENGFVYVFENNICILHYKVCAGPVGFGVEVPDLCHMFASRDGTLYFGDIRLPAKSSNGQRDANSKGCEWLSPVRLRDVGGTLICSSAKLQFNTVAVRRRKDGSVYALAGTADHHLLLLNVKSRQLLRVLNVGHSGEIWALAHHPGMENGLRIFASGDSDGYLRFWDPDKRCPVVGRVLDFTADGIWWPRGKASNRNVSLNPHGIYSVTFNASGDLVALGHGEGTVRVLSFPELQPIFQHCVSKTRGRIWAVKFDPAGDLLAVACEDTFAYLVRIRKKDDRVVLSPYHQLKGNTSGVTNLQFNSSGSLLITNSQDAQVLCYDTETGKRKTAPHNETWAAPWTCKCGWPVIGMWAANKSLVINDINSCSSHITPGAPHGLLASADDDQKVKLYRFPAVSEEQGFREYGGHAAHVTAVRFAPDRGPPGANSLLVSAGGRDHALLQWEVQWPAKGRTSPVRRNQPNLPWKDSHPWKVKSTDSDQPPERKMRFPHTTPTPGERSPIPYYTAPIRRESEDYAVSVTPEAAAAGTGTSPVTPWATEVDRRADSSTPTGTQRHGRGGRQSSSGPSAGARRPPWGTAEDLQATSSSRTAPPPPFGVDTDLVRPRGAWPSAGAAAATPSWASQDVISGSPARAARRLSRGGRPASAGSTRRHSPL